MKFIKINNNIYNLNIIDCIETDKYMIHISFKKESEPCLDDREGIHAIDFYKEFFEEFKSFINSKNSHGILDLDCDKCENEDEEMDPAFSQFSPN